jgi:rubrerythrin
MTMSKTTENLTKAFAGESQASMRYLAFAEKADQEGYPGVAKLFRAAAKAEMYHAISHLRALGVIQGTMENIQTAIDGETQEFKEMYPAMVKDAVADKDIEARHSLEYAMSIEMIHAKMFKAAMENPEANADAVYYICPVCGNTVKDNPPKKCPYCGVDAKDFVEVA